MVTGLRAARLWQGAALLAGLLCAILIAHPLTARAAGVAPGHPTTARAAEAVDPTPSQIAVTGTDGALWTEGSGGWFSLGGYLLAAPAVASMPDPSGVNPGLPVFIGTGTDHRLYVRDLAHSWQVLTPSAYCVNNPAATIVSAHAAGEYLLMVACRGSDNGLWFNQELVSPGTLPAPLLPMVSLGGVLIDGPAVAAVNPLQAGSVPAEMTFFALGTDNHVWTRTVLSGWQQMPWGCIGHPAAATSLSSISTNPPELTVFACHGTDGQLWAASNTGFGWTSPVPLGGALVDGPGVSVDSQAVYFDAEGTTRQIYLFNTGWFSIGGLTYTGAAEAALLYAADNP